jgi:hypothetical protein
MPKSKIITKYKIDKKYKIIKFIRLLAVIFILSFSFALLLFIMIHGEKISQIEKTSPIDIEVNTTDNKAS